MARIASCAAVRLLVNFFYAHPVGHAVEALHYALGHHAAGPGREVSVALNAATAVRLAQFCPFVKEVYAIDHPFLEPCGDSAARLAALPREWDWIYDDGRRYQDFQLEAFPGMRDYYAASDVRLQALVRRSVAGYGDYVPHTALRFRLPVASSLGARIAVMPAGSSERSLYPSAGSWELILDALTDAFPDAPIALVGKTGSTALEPGERERLLAHRSRPLDVFDVDLAEQLAVVEAADVFVAPHTGFGLAALAVGTPWLALSGGRWFEYFFNHVPFRSVIPSDRYPVFSQFVPAEVVAEEDGPRTPSMTRARFEEDLDRIVAAAGELLAGSLSYEQALSDYFRDLVAAHDGETAGIWSIDGIHAGYV